MEINNNVAAVTGGASGLGRAAVEHFVSNGAKVAILDINDEKAAEVIDLLGVDNVSYIKTCLLYTSPSPRDGLLSRMPSSA